MSKGAPCKACVLREVGCHGKCKLYQEYRTAKDVENAQRYKEKYLETYDPYGRKWHTPHCVRGKGYKQFRGLY